MEPSLVVIAAHPYLTRSRANRALLDAARALPGIDLRPLYDLYPSFDIDVGAEQAALARASVVVWQHPMYWYSPPALLKHWFDKVLAYGWAYGEGGTALRGKRCLWVTTTGGDAGAFRFEGMHGHPLTDFVPPLEQTARFCGMHWEAPLVFQGVHRASDETLLRAGYEYRTRLEELLGTRGDS